MYDVGLIGLSSIGTWHQKAYAAVDGIEVVAIADIDQDLLADRGENWGIDANRRYRSHTELLEAESLDVVSVATPTYLHHEHVLDVVESRADPDVIWAEKPIASSVSEAEEMVRVCEEADIELVINHTRRFGAPYQILRELMIEDRILGDVQSIHTSSPEELLRNGTHAIDLVDYLLDDSFEWGFGYLTGHSATMGSEFDDTGGAAMILTEGDTYVNVDCTVPRGMHAGNISLVGAEGKLHFDQSDGEYRYWRVEESEDNPYGLQHVETDLPRPLRELNDREAMFQRAAEHLVELLDGKTENISPGTDAAHVLEIIVAVFISHYTGTAIDLPLESPLRDVKIRSV